jgi:ABC-type lipoprotein export system ATPase subunit
MSAADTQGLTPSDEDVIVVRGVKRSFPVGSGEVRALQQVDLTIRRGEFVALMGASGSGKSTLLNILGCLDTPSAGEYWLEGARVRSLSPDQRASLRNRRIGFVFQSFNLMPRLSGLENVALPLYYQNQSTPRARQRALEVLRQVGLSGRSEHLPAQLSGGECQRLAIARALVTGPAILLADEPTGNLDSKTGHEIMALLRDLNDQGRTILVVTHDHQVARYAGRRLVMQDGFLTEEEPGNELP